MSRRQVDTVGFLEGLTPEFTSTYDASGLCPKDIENLLQKESRMSPDLALPTASAQRGSGAPTYYVVLYNILPDTMEELSQQGHLGRVKDWSENLRSAVIKVLSKADESVSRAFELRLWENLNYVKLKLAHKLSPRGSTTVKGSDREKQADVSFVPRRLPAGRPEKWPTLVLEAGYSESERKLEDDAKWWLEDSQGAVKVAIIIKLYPQRRVHFQLWQLDDSSAPPQAQVTQEVTVIKQDNSAISASGTLVIPFDDLFLGNMGTIQNEVILDKEDLEDICRSELE